MHSCTQSDCAALLHITSDEPFHQYLLMHSKRTTLSKTEMRLRAHDQMPKSKSIETCFRTFSCLPQSCPFPCRSWLPFSYTVPWACQMKTSDSAWIALAIFAWFTVVQWVSVARCDRAISKAGHDSTVTFKWQTVHLCTYYIAAKGRAALFLELQLQLIAITVTINVSEIMCEFTVRMHSSEKQPVTKCGITLSELEIMK